MYRNKLDKGKRSDFNLLYHKYNLEPLETLRKRNLLKSMYGENKREANIDMYRPERTLRSAAHVNLNHRFTRLTKI